MQAWAALMDVQPKPWEVAALRRLDALWRSAWARGRERHSKTPKESD